MAIDYSGVSNVAQAAIAFNLAYIALERFRYKAKIERKLEEVKSRLTRPLDRERDPIGYHYMHGIPTGDDQAWGQYIYSRWFYRHLFNKGHDRTVCYILISFCLFLLFKHAYHGLITESSGASVLAAPFSYVDALSRWAIMLALLVSLAAPIAFILMGRHIVARAQKRYTEISDTLGANLVGDLESKLSAAESRLRETETGQN